MLKTEIESSLLPFVDTLENVKAFKIGCCGKILDPNILEIIKELEKSMYILQDKFSVSVTNKMHILVTHVPEYIMETHHSLGQTSDQIIESSHQYINKRFDRSNYKVKDVTNPIHGENLLKGVKHINTYNAVTK